MTNDIAKSNSLADLAARINAEHQASLAHMQGALQSAISAGRLLIEAKLLVKHGQWLPWLAKHCEIPERTATLYMRLARRAPELEEQIGNGVADLTVRRAIDLLAPPEADLDDFDSFKDWVQQQLDGPFTTFDFPDDYKETDYDWIGIKMRHQLGLPWVVDWCFGLCDYTEDGQPPLRLASWDDLIESAKRIAPLVADEGVDRKQLFKFDGLPDMYEMRFAIGTVEIETMCMLGHLLSEIEYRTNRKVSEEQLEKESDEIYSAVMARLEAKIAEFKQAAE